MAVAYPLRSRFRTGVTMAMFMLVVFTLVTGSTIPTAFVNSFDDVERFGGGFDIGPRPRRPPPSPTSARSSRRAWPSDIVADGAQSFVPVEARQDDAGRAFERYPLRGVDDAFLDRTTYEFAAMATRLRHRRGRSGRRWTTDPAWPWSTPSSPPAATSGASRSGPTSS